MVKIIQIRNVPERLHRKLVLRAAAAGMSLSDYVLQEIRKTAERPTIEELKGLLKRQRRHGVSAEKMNAAILQRHSVKR
jgi:antitoxin FitA